MINVFANQFIYLFINSIIYLLLIHISIINLLTFFSWIIRYLLKYVKVGRSPLGNMTSVYIIAVNFRSVLISLIQFGSEKFT